MTGAPMPRPPYAGRCGTAFATSGRPMPGRQRLEILGSAPRPATGWRFWTPTMSGCLKSSHCNSRPWALDHRRRSASPLPVSGLLMAGDFNWCATTDRRKPSGFEPNCWFEISSPGSVHQSWCGDRRLKQWGGLPPGRGAKIAGWRLTCWQNTKLCWSMSH